MPSRRIAVVGAGIAGLAAAEYLRDASADVEIFEASDAVGGRMKTLTGFQVPVDVGAKVLNLNAHTELLRLLGRHGLLPRLRPLGGEYPFAVWHGGASTMVGRTPPAVLSGPLLSWRDRWAMLRLASDILTHLGRYDVDHPERAPVARYTVDELRKRYPASFVTEVLHTVATGIYSMPPTHAGAAMLFNQFLAARGAPGANMFYLAGGMGSVAEVLAERFGVTTGTPIDAVERSRVGYNLMSGSARFGPFAGVVLALPAPHLARMDLPAFADPVDSYVRAAAFSQQAQVVLQYAEGARPGYPDVYGVAFRADMLTGLAWLSQEDIKHHGMTGVTGPCVHLGLTPDLSGELLAADDETIIEIALTRLRRCFSAVDDGIVGTRVLRLDAAMPLLGPQLMAVRTQFLAAAPSGLELAGDWLNSPSTEGAVRSGRRAAVRVLAGMGAVR
ncbi:FAD-dependent oxidoreductase [Nocardia sp. NPDC058658]|uniref:FAD-dependent oxidoreductase n=1 Tax=Nocardia sp. NPDC058658 TaxID=3346580 RepID=UPI00366460D8